MSIRVRLLLLILFATLIPALVSVFHFVERRDAEITEAAHRLSAEAGRVALELKDMVRGTAQLHYGCPGQGILTSRTRRPAPPS